MSSFAALVQQHNQMNEKLLSDCVVEFGRSAAWSSKLLPQAYSGERIVAGERVQARGQFSAPYVTDLDFEGYRPSVSFPSFVPAQNAIWQDDIVQQGDRLAILQDYAPVDIWMAYSVTRVKHDGKGRTLCDLVIIGPMCNEVNNKFGYPYSYGTPYGVMKFDHCADIDRELSHHD